MKKTQTNYVLMTFGEALKNPDIDWPLYLLQLLEERETATPDDVLSINAQIDKILELLMERAPV